ncbi:MULTISPECIES: NAD(P)/FAD-dependent oxidoreductase [Streptomyces albovinaceus subgroup]|uniref:Oxidoreductase in 4-hydroxyproline catabolic gene cluster n=2 Tax=Streptomyces TaxID=1883 RepID=A0ABM9GTU9_STRGL|nr:MULTISPECIES: NAD(P)/FAD-dependent oxidoreductase [Streptomyces]RDL08019.1 pyruvate/2-oxoglutarate dehydrogenase complex dihydrolipoamide dehydrogenase (E3) component [Streptomyces sp. HB202]WSU80326.1 FAD-dependent oxidoreductase [Streptomyces globisporus]GGW13285.1 oxidase [Streptomyces globisporus]CAH9414917.1 Putative oxidoreductase in 4-hydroxyproline catabolic gene cluster [Streptomyces globisporus]
MAEPQKPVDLVVVGAGPAGMAAAVTALDGGLRVVLVDAGSAPGGQFWRHPPDHAREALPTDDLHHDLRTYRSLRATLAAHQRTGRLTLLLDHPVWTTARAADGFTVHAVDRGRPPEERAVVLRAPALLVATGAYDRQLPFPGWDLPGVLTAGGLQSLLKGGGVVAGRRVVLGGTGPFLLPVAAALAARGAEVVAVCEAAAPSAWLRHPAPLLRNPAKWAEAAGYAGTLARHRIPVRTRTGIVGAEGEGRVAVVRTAALGADGAPLPGTERRIEADTVGVGWGFVPQLDLLLPLGCDLADAGDGTMAAAVDAGQRTTVPGLYAAGETCGVGGAALALSEGRVAAVSVLTDLSAPGRPGIRPLAAQRRAVARHRAFARALARAHPVPRDWPAWLTDDTTVCRCEEVTAGAVLAARADGSASDHRQVKQLTRAGMGWCQGRMCGPAVHCLVAARAEPYTPAERLIATPVTLGALADSAEPSTGDTPSEPT